MWQRLLVGLLLSGMAAALGCGEGNPLGRQAVSGTVSLNGTPLEKGNILFVPTQKGPVLSGAVISKGQFSIAAESGLTPGEYAVKVDAPDTSKLPAKPDRRNPVVPPSLIPAEWTQGLAKKVTITEQGPNTFTFDITK